jgi:hypothetical protein
MDLFQLGLAQSCRFWSGQMGEVKVDDPKRATGRCDIDALCNTLTVKRVRGQGDRLSG